MERYKRVKTIGKGAFGLASLVQARSDPTQRYVIKEIDITMLKPDAREVAMQEVALLKAFDHPNIVRYVESFTEAGTLHIVMDYAEGGDLRGLISERRAESRLLLEEQVVDYFVQLALAMQHVHERK
eukprot:5195490-Prymnesium_polylepis.1